MSLPQISDYHHLKYSIKILGSHYEEMTRCETSRDLKKMEEESRAIELALEGYSLIISCLFLQEKLICYSMIIVFIFLVPL